MFADTNNPNTFTDTVRQDFCFSCALHGLIPEASIEGLLGEITYQNLPSGGRYDKHTLVQQCLSDPERIQNLITELDNMDGNVGAVCHALTEVMARLCQNRETLPLKLLCSQLAKKPLSLDVILLFEKPATILRPLCDLLDSWRYEEDQGEYQPVYEEFGSILLLLLSFVYRYNLTPADLGIHANKESFVVKLLTKGTLARPLEELTEQEAANLGRWVQGLFATDAGGLSDELLSSCPPQDFYLLIPSLFHQIILAFSRGVLTEESVKAGVEYLVDAFLVPSLITAITFVATHLWVDQKLEHKAALRILHMILLSPVSAEAASLLDAVKTSIAQPLTHSLRTYQRRDPKSQDIEPLLRALKDSLPVSRRTLAANHNELESWASTANGGLSAALKNTIVSLVTWALGPELNVPTSYTHRQLLAALQRLGAKKTLRLLVDEIILVTGDGRAEAPAPPPETLGVVYDVVASLICAPDVIAEAADAIPSTAAPGAPPTSIPSIQRRMGLREALRHAAEDAKRTQRTEPAFAEACVRLYRRVEELLTPVVIPAAVEADDAAAAAAAAAAVAVAAEAVVQDGLALAMDVDLDGIDAAGAAAGSGTGADSAGAMGDISMGMGDLEGMPLDGLDFGSGTDDLVLSGMGGMGDMGDGFNWEI